MPKHRRILRDVSTINDRKLKGDYTSYRREHKTQLHKL